MKTGGKTLKSDNILKKVRTGVQTLAYNNLLYRKILASGEGPDRLHFTMPDQWPGDAQAGMALLSGQRSMFESGSAVSLRQAGTVLRNLRAVGTDSARKMAVGLIASWLDQHDGWSEAEWTPDVLGERIAAWIGSYEFYAPAAMPEFLDALTQSLQRQWKHLARVMPPNLNGIAGLRAIKGLVYGGLNFPEGEKALGHAVDLLQRQLKSEILPDGGMASRNPSSLLHTLRHLIDLRTAFRAAELPSPEAIDIAINAMIPALKFFRHGDGGLALFHGGCEETALLADAVLTRAEAKGRILRRLPDTGYERLTAERSILIADCAPPPPRGFDTSGHAGLLAFEFGNGKERVIVNCGAVQLNGGGGPPAWRIACAATAAHSKLTVEDTNACEVMASGNVMRSAHVTAQRYEQDGNHYVEMSHNGYQQKFGLVHYRILALSADGEELRGQDLLEGSAGMPGRNFSIRWHLHPGMQASLAQSGQTVLLRTPGGNGWRLRVDQGGNPMQLSLDPSVYCGSGSPRRSLQLRVSGVTSGAQTSVGWSLMREKKQ